MSFTVASRLHDGCPSSTGASMVTLNGDEQITSWYPRQRLAVCCFSACPLLGKGVWSADVAFSWFFSISRRWAVFRWCGLHWTTTYYHSILKLSSWSCWVSRWSPIVENLISQAIEASPVSELGRPSLSSNCGATIHRRNTETVGCWTLFMTSTSHFADFHWLFLLAGIL